MKGRLEEANRILKGLSARTGEAESRTKDERLTAMQGQLDELRKLKVLRLSRIGKEQEAYGLLDSGATNPMRGKRRGEDLSQLEEVQVTLADGSQVGMKITASGVMVVEDEWAESHCPTWPPDQQVRICGVMEERAHDSKPPHSWKGGGLHEKWMSSGIPA